VEGAAGLRAVGDDGLELASGGTNPDGAGPVGSALMMLTGGIEADDGK
jgi:hypothetical protein